jgi:hypothetical protein
MIIFDGQSGGDLPVRPTFVVHALADRATTVTAGVEHNGLFSAFASVHCGAESGRSAT